jgi:hypothetical protein
MFVGNVFQIGLFIDFLSAFCCSQQGCRLPSNHLHDAGACEALQAAGVCQAKLAKTNSY